MSVEFNYIAKGLGKKQASTLWSGPVFGELEKDTIYTFSGKSSLALLLRYYRSVGRLRDRSDNVLVPQWLGDPVYMVMHEYCFPSVFMNERVRGIMVYHQWGFPQDMDYIKNFCDDKKLFYIEDCAHSYESYYRGQRVGTFGDAAFFSLSKFFPSVLGGAIYTQNGAIKSFVKEKFSEEDATLAKKVFSRRLKYDKAPTPENTIELRRDYAIYGKLLKCQEYSLNVSRREVSVGAIAKRKANYDLYKKVFGAQKYLSDLVKEDVVPWVVPVFFNEGVNRKLVDKLRGAGIKTGVYHFDVNRNMLRPDFRECVPLPCHQGMGGDDVARVIDIVRRAVK